MAIKNKALEVPADLANLNGVDDAPPKMEMAALPPEAAAAPPQMLTTNVPGTIAPAAMVFSLPELKQVHFYEVFPHMAPRAAGPANPGVFMNADGSVYTPRQRRGGQFAAHQIVIQHKWDVNRIRKLVVPSNTLPDDYGTKDYEQVIARVEIIFDFEDQLHSCLEAFGQKALDPITQGLARKGLLSAYDDVETMPGLKGQRFASV